MPLSKVKSRIAKAIVRRIPEQGLYILRNLILTDLKPYLDKCQCPPPAQRLCDELEVIMAEIATRESLKTAPPNGSAPNPSLSTPGAITSARLPRGHT
jgi:hypothetical protein